MVEKIQMLACANYFLPLLAKWYKWDVNWNHSQSIYKERGQKTPGNILLVAYDLDRLRLFNWIENDNSFRPQGGTQETALEETRPASGPPVLVRALHCCRRESATAENLRVLSGRLLLAFRLRAFYQGHILPQPLVSLESLCSPPLALCLERLLGFGEYPWTSAFLTYISTMVVLSPGFYSLDTCPPE